MARETENLGLYLADDEDTFQNYVTNQSASMNHNMEILDSYIPDELNSKVDKVTGKTLSTNDYTDEDKGLVASAIQPDDYATTSSAGLVKPDGTTVTVDADGTIHGASTYTLPTASSSTKGGIKIGDHLHMDGEVLSADGGIAVQDEEPTDVDVWIDTDEEGADFCYVGDTEPPNDGSVAVWVDTSEDERVSTIEVGDTAPTDDSVQIWVDTSAGANLADYIVEQGTSGIWTYRKWASGIAECWGSNNYAINLIGPTNYMYYQSSSGTTTNLPTDLFSERPKIHISATAQYLLATITSSSNKTSFQLNIFSPYQVQNSNCNMDIYCIGRWK